MTDDSLLRGGKVLYIKHRILFGNRNKAGYKFSLGVYAVNKGVTVLTNFTYFGIKVKW
jgi:hypothetical protein